LATTLHKLDRRVAIRVPVNMGTFLDLICKLSRTRKARLWEQVLAAGMREVFGITPEELDDCSFTVPADLTGLDTDDLKELTNLLCGEG
jgi:hypothetical protein